jgi:sigma-B regulation protein RsbU (phosphoserine phosphatase)
MGQSNSTQELEQLKTENFRLRVAVEELSVLNDIATAISSTLELDRVVGMIVQKCVKHLKGEQGAIWLLEEQDQEKPLVTVVRTQNSEIDGLPYRLDTQLTGWMIKNQKPLIVQDLETDDRFQITNDEGSYIRSLLAVPLQQKGKMIGVLTVFNKRGDEGFIDEDRRLLTIIGAQSAQVIESARLYQEEQELFKMMGEMNLAQKIQTNLLPAEPPKLEGYEAFGISISAKDVGGDYYDFIFKDTDKMIFCLGDVSGKGMPAALLMANLQATLRGQAMGCSSALDCMKKSNQLLYHSTDLEKYATLFYGVVYFNDHQLIFANAGHNNPFLVSQDGSVQRLETVGIPLGWLEDFDYTEEKVPLIPGDILVTFSDGISESMNSLEEEFEEESILDIIMQNLSASPKEITEKIVAAAQAHAGGAPQADDMTLVVIKRL